MVDKLYLVIAWIILFGEAVLFVPFIKQWADNNPYLALVVWAALGPMVIEYISV